MESVLRCRKAIKRGGKMMLLIFTILLLSFCFGILALKIIILCGPMAPHPMVHMVPYVEKEDK